MFQNRVNPFGQLIETKARGLWMGNRGLLHNGQQQILRPFKLKAWITCVLEFKDRKRPIMAAGQYTELFFLDEVTAFAAGHRPCFECRRVDAARFKLYWIQGNPEYGFDMKTPIGKIDEILHQERVDSSGAKVVYEAVLSSLPDGTFVQVEDGAYLLKNQQLFHWSPAGYGAQFSLPESTMVKVLTPASIVNAFSAGYI
uniref:hypothetical protein n=1 Tax=Pedobacter schmidteae TaxID=2201271 RepID=UPI000EB34F79|nr:hypothetical protein [Pedobacter schmidteae]